MSTTGDDNSNGESRSTTRPNGGGRGRGKDHGDGDGDEADEDGAKKDEHEGKEFEAQRRDCTRPGPTQDWAHRGTCQKEARDKDVLHVAPHESHRVL